MGQTDSKVDGTKGDGFGTTKQLLKKTFVFLSSCFEIKRVIQGISI